MSQKRYDEYFEESTKEKGVYLLTIGYKGSGGHATVLQRLSNGKLVRIEPQSYQESDGIFFPIESLSSIGNTKPIPTRGILRIDNRVFNQKFVSIFEMP